MSKQSFLGFLAYDENRTFLMKCSPFILNHFPFNYHQLLDNNTNKLKGKISKK